MTFELHWAVDGECKIYCDVKLIPGDKRENACDDISDILETSAWESFPR